MIHNERESNPHCKKYVRQKYMSREQLGQKQLVYSIPKDTEAASGWKHEKRIGYP